MDHLLLIFKSREGGRKKLRIKERRIENLSWSAFIVSEGWGRGKAGQPLFCASVNCLTSLFIWEVFCFCFCFFLGGGSDNLFWGKKGVKRV